MRQAMNACEDSDEDTPVDNAPPFQPDTIPAPPPFEPLDLDEEEPPLFVGGTF